MKIRCRPVIAYDCKGFQFFMRPNRFNRKFLETSLAISKGEVITLEAALEIIMDQTEKLLENGPNKEVTRLWSDWALGLLELGYRVEIRPEDWEISN